MPRIPIIDARRYECRTGAGLRHRQSRSRHRRGPYNAYIRLPKLFKSAQGLRESLSGGQLSQREQQIVNFVVARHWNAR